LKVIVKRALKLTHQIYSFPISFLNVQSLKKIKMIARCDIEVEVQEKPLNGITLG
jgi:hypothetical protein